MKHLIKKELKLGFFLISTKNLRKHASTEMESYSPYLMKRILKLLCDCKVLQVFDGSTYQCLIHAPAYDPDEVESQIEARLKEIPLEEAVVKSSREPRFCILCNTQLTADKRKYCISCRPIRVREPRFCILCGKPCEGYKYCDSCKPKHVKKDHFCFLCDTPTQIAGYCDSCMSEISGRSLLDINTCRLCGKPLTSSIQKFCDACCGYPASKYRKQVRLRSSIEVKT